MTQVISTKGKTMIYLFFMVIKFCWQEILFLKCSFLVAIANLESGYAIKISNLEDDKYRHIRGELCWLHKSSDKKLK